MAFWKRKKKKTPDLPLERDDSNQSPQIKSMLNAINEQEPSDPLIRAKITGKDITAVTINMLKDEKGVRIEAALGVLGSLAGASCAYAMLDLVKRDPEKMVAPEVAIVGLKSGGSLMFGDYINRKLVEGEQVGAQTLSLWHLFAGMAQHHLGEMPKIDLRELFGRVSEQGGTPDFGKVNVPDEHSPGDLPQNFVAKLFPQYLPVLARYDLPKDQYWLALGLSAQEVMGMGKDTADLSILTRVAMECAVYASKLDMSEYLTKDI